MNYRNPNADEFEQEIGKRISLLEEICAELTRIRSTETSAVRLRDLQAKMTEQHWNAEDWIAELTSNDASPAPRLDQLQREYHEALRKVNELHRTVTLELTDRRKEVLGQIADLNRDRHAQNAYTAQPRERRK